MEVGEGHDVGGELPALAEGDGRGRDHAASGHHRQGLPQGDGCLHRGDAVEEPRRRRAAQVCDGRRGVLRRGA